MLLPEGSQLVSILNANFIHSGLNVVFRGRMPLRTTCVLSRFSRVQLSVTPWTAARQAPQSRGVSRQEDWSGLPCPPPGDLPSSGIKHASLSLLHGQVGSL